MKLLYTVILLLATLQLGRAKPLNNSTTSNSLATGEQLARDYHDEYHLLAQEICLKIKTISEEILEDDNVKQSTAHLMQELKKNMTRFQQIYPFYKRFGLDTVLVTDFSKMLAGYYNPSPNPDKNAVYILHLIEKLGYDEIRNENKKKLKNFLDEKLLPKAEEMKTQLTNKPNINQSDVKVLQWIAVLKQCQEYECFLVEFHAYEKQNADALSQFFGELFDEIFDTLIIFSHNVTVFAKDVLQDPKLSQLRAPLRQQLMQNMQDLIKIHDSVGEPQQVLLLPIIYYNVLFKFDNYGSISLQERQLITNIFDEHNYASLSFLKNQNDDRLGERDYLKAYENKITSFSQAYLAKQKSFFEELVHLRNSSSLKESCAALNRMQSLLSDVK